MEQKDLIDKRANQDQLVNPGAPATGASSRDENGNAGGETTRRTKKEPAFIGRGQSKTPGGGERPQRYHQDA